MCKWCMSHGAGGKWYLNARNYSKELADEYQMKEHLTEVYKDFESIFVKKAAYGMSAIGVGYKLRMPVIGRVVRNIIDKITHNEGPKRRIVGSDGHFGQVIPVEEAKMILDGLAAEPIIINNCPCSIIMRGKKDARCISFGVLSEVMEKLPRYIPKGVKYQIDREEAMEKIEEFNNQGYVHSIYFQPVPYINALCSCDKRDCMAMGGRLNFDFNILYKGEYVATINPDLCDGCKECSHRCQFNALHYSPLNKQMFVNQDKCFGCGNCTSTCEFDAITLVSRESVPAVAGHY